MSEHTAQKQLYMVSIHEPKDGRGRLVFTFVPKARSQGNGPSNARRHPPQYIVGVRSDKDGRILDWSESPDDPGPAKQEIEAEIDARMTDRTIWIERVGALVNQLEQWATEMHWSTRRVEKRLNDVRVGEHRVPALLMQEDTCRILLEPVGRSGPGNEGVVDLYLMPAYDDIASLYYYENGWHLHYMFSDTKPVASIREGAATLLSKDSFEKVLAEMRQNAT